MASKPPFPLMASGRGLPANGSGEPLSTAVRRGVLALVVFFHVGGGWALTQFEPAKLIVGDIASLEVRTVPAELPVQPETEKADLPPEPPEPEPQAVPVLDIVPLLLKVAQPAVPPAEETIRPVVDAVPKIYALPVVVAPPEILLL